MPASRTQIKNFLSSPYCLEASLPPTLLPQNVNQSRIADPPANPPLCERHTEAPSWFWGGTHTRSSPGLPWSLSSSCSKPCLLLHTFATFLPLSFLFFYHRHESQPGCRPPVPHVWTRSRGSNKGAPTVWHLAVDFHAENRAGELFNKANEALCTSKLGQAPPWYKMSLTGVQGRKELRSTRGFSSLLGCLYCPRAML